MRRRSSTRYEFHPEALAEYKEAAHYFESVQTDLDLRFINAVEKAIGQIMANPDRWNPTEEDVRRHLTQVFPYAILYTIEPDYILIVAIAHCSREPGYWKHRIA